MTAARSLYASREAVIINGKIMMPKVREPERIDAPNLKNTTNKAQTK